MQVLIGVFHNEKYKAGHVTILSFIIFEKRNKITGKGVKMLFWHIFVYQFFEFIQKLNKLGCLNESNFSNGICVHNILS